MIPLDDSRRDLCCNCKQMYADDDYYEGQHIGCNKDHWPDYILTPADLGDALRLSRTCEDFEPEEK